MVIPGNLSCGTAPAISDDWTITKQKGEQPQVLVSEVV